MFKAYRQLLISLIVLSSLGGIAAVHASGQGEIISWGSQKTPNAPLTNITKIAAGYGQSLTLTSDGSIVGWGLNDHGQAMPPAGNNFIAIAAGGYHSLAIKKYVCQFVLAGDINSDCKVDFRDFAAMAENWLIDCDANPSNPACVPR